jgi:hypothetical protein
VQLPEIMIDPTITQETETMTDPTTTNPITPKYNARLIIGRIGRSEISGAVTGTVVSSFSASSREEAAARAQQEANRLGKRVWLSLIGSDATLFTPAS